MGGSLKIPVSLLGPAYGIIASLCTLSWAWWENRNDQTAINVQLQSAFVETQREIRELNKSFDAMETSFSALQAASVENMKGTLELSSRVGMLELTNEYEKKARN